MKKTWFLYIIKCSDNSFYTGITTNIDKRVAQHNAKKGAKAIKGRLPAVLVYTETHSNRSTASKREREIKSLSHKEKAAMVTTLTV